jgi:hypothetical protein
MNNKIVFQKNMQLTGKEANVDLQGRIPFVANFDGPVYPVVTIKAVNNEVSGTTEIVLPAANNIEVNRPATPSKLYLVDNLTHVYELNKIEDKTYDFITTADLSAIGSSFKIAEKLTSDNKIDYKGIVWGMKEDEIVTIEDESGSPIPINTQDGVIDLIAFNIYSFLISGAAPVIEIDFAAFETSSYENYKQLTLSLKKGAGLEFIGFGDDVSKILRPDYFINISGTEANFDGLLGEYTLLYNELNGLIYVENNDKATFPESLWIDGTGYGFPQSPYIATGNWGFTPPHSVWYCKKIAEGIFEAVMYIENGGSFKIFTRKNWSSPEFPEYGPLPDGSNEIILNVPISIMGGCDALPPKPLDFAPKNGFDNGVYKMTINMNPGVMTTLFEPFGN